VEGDHIIIPLQGQWVFALIIQSIRAVCCQCHRRADPLADGGKSFSQLARPSGRKEPRAGERSLLGRPLGEAIVALDIDVLSVACLTMLTWFHHHKHADTVPGGQQGNSSSGREKQRRGTSHADRSCCSSWSRGEADANPTVSADGGNWATAGATLTCGLTRAWKAEKPAPARPPGTMAALSGPAMRLVREVGAPQMSERGKGSHSSFRVCVALKLWAAQNRWQGGASGEKESAELWQLAHAVVRSLGPTGR
jgi:hypothetical protein